MKKGLSILLCVCLMFGMMAVSAPQRAEAAETPYDYEIWQLMEYAKGILPGREASDGRQYNWYAVIKSGNTLILYYTFYSSFDVQPDGFNQGEMSCTGYRIMYGPVYFSYNLDTKAFTYSPNVYGIVTYSKGNGNGVLYSNAAFNRREDNSAMKYVMSFFPTSYDEFTYVPPFVKSTEIEVGMNKTEVSVTVPLNVNCYINPNEEEAFTHSDLGITNNSYAPVKISLASFHAVGGERTFVLPDGLPEDLAWKNLNMEQSAKYFSIGVVPSNEVAWQEVLATDFAYAENVSEKMPLGILPPRGQCFLDMSAYFGGSFTSSESIPLTMGFVAELYLD